MIAGALPRLSVIIPTLDEAEHLPALLSALAEQRGVKLETIVADGGSRDTTRQIASHHGCNIIEGPAGRGRQMNRGASQASCPWLLFLHADSGLTSVTQLADSLKALQKVVKDAGHARVAGHFKLKFARSRPGMDLAYRYYEEKSALNRPECTNGDQGLLLAREFFTQLRGFDESLWFLEDQRIAEMIHRKGLWITLPGELVTSARRFEREGLARRMLLSAMIMNFHAMGLTEFFVRADDIYLHQDRTGKLDLAPIFNLVDEMNRAAGKRLSRQRWLATGRYLSGHVWQSFFWLDVAMQHRFGRERRVFLPFHDRFVSPLCRLRPVHYLTAGLVWIGFKACRGWLNRRRNQLA